MVVGWVRIGLRIEASHSLKEKRRALRSLIDALRARLPVAVAEVDDQDLHNVATLGLATVSGHAGLAADVIERAIRLVEDHAEVQVEELEQQIEHV